MVKTHKPFTVYVGLLISLFLFVCAEINDPPDNEYSVILCTVPGSTANTKYSMYGTTSFSVHFVTLNLPPSNYIIDHFVMNSADYSDTICYQQFNAKNTIRINYQGLPDIDMDIIFSGDSFPEKINNIKQNKKFINEVQENDYYSHEYSILYHRKLDSLRISTKNITTDNIDDFKTYLANTGVSVYKTSYLSNLDRFQLFITIPGGFEKNILKQLVLNQNVKYVMPLGYIGYN